MNKPRKLFFKASGRNLLVFFLSFILISNVFPTVYASANPPCGQFFDTYTRVSVSGNGDVILSGDPVTGFISLFAKDGTSLWSYRTGSNITSISVSDDASTVAAASNDGRVFLFDREGNLLWLSEKNGCYPKIEVTSDGDRIYLANSDNPDVSYTQTLHYLDRNGNVVWETRVPGISDMAITENGKNVIVGTRIGRNSEVLSYAENGTKLWSVSEPEGISLVTVSDNGDTVGAIHSYRLVLMNNSGGLISESIPKYQPSCIAASLDGESIVTGSEYMIQTFARNGSVLWQSYTRPVTDVAVSKSNPLIFAGSDNGVSVYTINGSTIATLPVDDRVGSVSVSADGNTVAAGTYNSSVCVFDRMRKKNCIGLTNLTTSPLRSPITIKADDVTYEESLPENMTKTPLHPNIAILACAICILLISMSRRQ